MNDDGTLPKRIVCIDESCIGTMGPDGRCRVCGTVIQTPDMLDSVDVTEPVAAQPEPLQQPADAGTASDIAQVPEADNEQEDDWHNRVLCPDESCTGTLGKDGRCRVCGRAGEG